MLDTELQDKIRRGEIDPNNQTLFFSTLYKAFIFEMNHMIKVRGEYVPHFLLNTGDDIMYLENKGQDHSIEPLDISNENYIYNKVPRCVLELGNIEVLSDQLTSPYSRGSFDIEYNDVLYSFLSEFRRIPVKTNVTLKYYFDNLTDCFDASQKLISNCMFVKNFSFDYMGQSIFATYKIPTSVDKEMNIQFDGLSQDNKCRTMSMDFEIETNYPVFDTQTVINKANYISSNPMTDDMWRLKVRKEKIK